MKKINHDLIKDDFSIDYPFLTSKELSEKYNISIDAVFKLRKELGLKKDKKHFKRIFEQKENKNGVFKKGNTPPLKGKKVKDVYSKEAYEKFKKIGFKKGVTPCNSHPLGYEKKYKKGDSYYWYIKTELSNSMVKKHVYIWEKANGKIPRGYKLRFKDGDTLNCTLENLECISMEENMLRNNPKVKHLNELIPAMAKIAEINKLIKTKENGKD